MRLTWTIAVLTALVALPRANVEAQTPDSIASGLRVFLDCERCDRDYIQTEIDFVDYVRERQDADVHILVTTQNTGAGGTQYSMQFVGLGGFAGVEEELRYASGPNDSQDQQRRGMARVLQGGLIRYATRTDLVQRLDLSVDDEEEGGGGRAGTTARDPWNAWVFEVGLNGNMDRESNQRESQVFGRASASRTTLDWKTEFDFSTRYSSDERLVRGNWIENVQRDHEVETLTVRSLTNHLSVGATSSANHSTFQNRDLALRLAPAIEYNFFPYSESTRRELTLLYSIGANRVTYLEETLFGEIEESLVDQALEVSLDMRQPWGELDAQLEGSHYLHDLKKYRLEANGGIEVNLFRGFSLDLQGSAERIHDQLHLPGGDLTPEEILLEQRELATAYRYGLSVGFSYSFGSIFNSVVNPRMGGGQGGGGGGGGGGGDFD